MSEVWGFFDLQGIFHPMSEDYDEARRMAYHMPSSLPVNPSAALVRRDMDKNSKILIGEARDLYRSLTPERYTPIDIAVMSQESWDQAREILTAMDEERDEPDPLGLLYLGLLYNERMI